MSTINNRVQLVGNIGEDPKVTDLESGKKVVRFSLATNENYTKANGDKVQTTDWHTIVAWGKTAEIVENYAHKGKKVGIVGKLKTRTYTEPKEGNERRVTEVVADEILLMGAKPEKATAE